MKSQCPNCSRINSVPDPYKDRKVKCTVCKETFLAIPYVKTCENCGENIGKLESTYKINHKIVCYACYRKLTTAENKPPEDVMPAKESSTALQGNCGSNLQPRCNLCNGEMVNKIISSGNVAGIVLALLVFAAGIIIASTALFCGGPLIGIPLCILALFLGGKRRKVLKCNNCGHTVDRT